MRDGRPVALLYVCHDAGYSRLSVSEDPPETEPDDHVVARWVVTGKVQAGLAELPLFGPLQPGWTLESRPGGATGSPAAEGVPGAGTVAYRALGTLGDGVRYALDGDSNRGAIPIGFTTADLPRIGADQVLAATGRDKTKVVSRAAFTRKASGSCR